MKKTPMKLPPANRSQLRNPTNNALVALTYPLLMLGILAIFIALFLKKRYGI